MSTPQENLETALDESADESERRAAVDGLEAANECDGLAEVARSDAVDEALRVQAITSLGHPQCEATLESLVEDGDLPDPLHERAATELAETPDDAGAGP